MTTLKEANFVYLLIGLLAVLIGAPIFVEFTSEPPKLVIEIGFAITVMIGIWSMVESKLWFRVGLILAVAAPAITALAYFFPAAYWEQVTLVIAFAFAGLSLGFALNSLFRTKRWDANSVYGAICIYLLLGIMLAILNVLIYRLMPGSFKGLGPAGDPTDGIDLIYYTFVTMTTLGYGDIVPIGPLARALAYLGAVMGQFYIAILVAMVIGMYLSQKSGSDE